MHHGVEIQLVAIVVVTLIIGAWLRVVAARTKVPFSVLMLVLGIGGGVALRAGFLEQLPFLHTILRTGSLISADVIMFAFLPALVFESAFALSPHAFRKDFGVVVWLAGPALLVTTVATAALVVGLTGAGVFGSAQWSWGWPAALVFGALISATDPVAVVAILRSVGAPKRLSVLIEGESLLNDGTAIVVFTVLLSMLVAGAGVNVDVGPTLLEFMRVVLLGVAVGLALAMTTAFLLSRTFNEPMIEITLTVALAYACMVIAEGIFHASGVLAIVAAGLYMAGPGRRRVSPEVFHFLHQFWEMLAYITNTLIFFLVGLVIALQLHGAGAGELALLLSTWAGIMVIRLVVTIASRPVTQRLAEPISPSESIVMSWGGLRGAVSLALALVVSQRPDIDATLRTQILMLTAGVVMSTIVINGSTTGWLLAKLGVGAQGGAARSNELSARLTVLHDVKRRIASVEDDAGLRTVRWDDVIKSLDQRIDRLHQSLADARNSGGDGAGAALGEAWTRALAIERSAYRHAFSEGTLGRVAATLLEHEIDRHEDRVQRGELSPPAPRSERAEPPLRIRDADRYALRYDIARGAALGAASVTTALAALRDHPEADGDDPTTIVAQTYRGYGKYAKEQLEDMRVNLPELAHAVEARLAARIALNFERAEFAAQKREGTLEGRAADEALGRVDEAMMHLAARRPDADWLPETADLCRQTALFRHLGADAIDDLANMTKEEAFVRGETLFSLGDRGDRMFIVARGAVHVLDEDDVVLATLGGGDILGEMALLTGAPRTATARAATTVTVGTVSADDFACLLDTRPKVRERIWAAFAARVLDNATRGARMFKDLGAQGRAEWIQRGRWMNLDAGEAIDTSAAAYVLVLTGSLDLDGTTTDGGLVTLDAGTATATSESRVVLLPALGVDEVA